LRPDGKTQVTVEYENGIPVRLDSIVVSAQHNLDITQEKIKEDIIEEVILPNVPDNLINDDINYYINPTGRFVTGGPEGDSGLTGRKIMVDTYGGIARHGGGAFSGKDPTKVDRSAAYALRHIAKSLVSANIADRCEIQTAYVIGRSEPVSLNVNTFGTSQLSDMKIVKIIKNNFDLRPKAIIENLGLKQPIYKPTACYGHFGRSDVEFPWEKVLDISRDSYRVAR